MNTEDWIQEIDDALKREKDWRKQGDDILEIYECDDEKRKLFNILYSNTETLIPALYSAQPIPTFFRRFNDEDPVGKFVGMAAERMVKYQMDTDIPGYESFNSAMKSVVSDALLPGRGVVAVKYEAEITKDNDGKVKSVEKDAGCVDSRPWNRFLHGYALKWEDVPWIAYEMYVDEKEAKALGLKTSGIKFTKGEEADGEDLKPKHSSEMGSKKTAQVYQIWDKTSRKVLYLSRQNRNSLLLELDDPLKLPGFFNTPKPLMFYQKNNLRPVPLYDAYENQAEELNKIQGRINKVVNAIKVRGAYHSGLANLEQILAGDDNELIQLDISATMAETGFDKLIYFLPIKELMMVLQELYKARESAKAVIYEITGISDIVRGQSVASETLGAQKIKETWGTMRLKSMQKETQRYALDLMILLLNVAIQQLDVKRWKQITNLPFPMEAEKKKAQELIKAANMQAAQAAEQAKMAGQPPAPPQIPPAVQQAANLPSWEEILKILKDDYILSYKVDLESNSTLDVEATDDKEQISEFMNAVAQLLNGLAPIMQSGPQNFELVKSMLLEITRRFRFGRQVEDTIKQLQAPQGGSPQMQEQQKQLQKQAEQVKQEQQKLEQQKKDLEHQQAMAKLQMQHEQQIAALKDKMSKEKVSTELEATFEKQQQKLQRFFDKKIAELDKKQVQVKKVAAISS